MKLSDAGQVQVLTNDGRIFVGILKGFDQVLNMVLAEAVERIFTPDAPVEIVALGVYLVRGDNVAVVSDLDPEKEAERDLDDVRAEPIPPVVH